MHALTRSALSSKHVTYLRLAVAFRISGYKRRVFHFRRPGM